MSHAADFGRESQNEQLAQQLVFDYQQADLSAADLALCRFAEKLTHTPGDMTEADIDQLRSAGFTDEQITIATQVVGYFNYINRVADALGVEPEDWMQPSAAEWRSQKAR